MYVWMYHFTVKALKIDINTSYTYAIMFSVIIRGRLTNHKTLLHCGTYVSQAPESSPQIFKKMYLYLINVLRRSILFVVCSSHMY